MDIQWESELAELLERLASSQEQLLSLLSQKHDLLMKRDHQGLTALASQEESLCAELQACHEYRQQLLERAAEQGLPADSIQSLTQALPSEKAQSLQQPLEESNRRTQLLRHQSISQWVVVQRTVLHLSHMLEIIATGGQLQPTYGKDGSSDNSGSLMDRAV
ncbi:MAG: flagellar protein FlgN [Planctomycetes bacterium]|nr:flagellar protein FlgN [Planctomycetota bacterium]